MFSKGSTKTQGREIREGATKSVPSIISADLKITGDLVSSGEIHIDGTVEGDIQCSALIVGVNGSVIGEIQAESVRLHGKVNGILRAKTVFLASTAHMIGDITHESLAIEPGAFMEGHCGRLSAEAESQDVKTSLDEAKKSEFSLSSTLASRPMSVVSDDLDSGDQAEAIAG